MDTLITNVTAVTMNPRMEVIFGAYIGIEGGKIVSTLYLREGDGTPVYGEIAVEGTVVLKAAFTDFTWTC